MSALVVGEDAERFLQCERGSFPCFARACYAVNANHRRTALTPRLERRRCAIIERYFLFHDTCLPLEQDTVKVACAPRQTLGKICSSHIGSGKVIRGKRGAQKTRAGGQVGTFRISARHDRAQRPSAWGWLSRCCPPQMAAERDDAQGGSPPKPCGHSVPFR